MTAINDTQAVDSILKQALIEADKNHPAKMTTGKKVANFCGKAIGLIVGVPLLGLVKRITIIVLDIPLSLYFMLNGGLKGTFYLFCATPWKFVSKLATEGFSEAQLAARIASFRAKEEFRLMLEGIVLFASVPTIGMISPDNVSWLAAKISIRMDELLGKGIESLEGLERGFSEAYAAKFLTENKMIEKDLTENQRVKKIAEWQAVIDKIISCYNDGYKNTLSIYEGLSKKNDSSQKDKLLSFKTAISKLPKAIDEEYIKTFNEQLVKTVKSGKLI